MECRSACVSAGSAATAGGPGNRSRRLRVTSRAGPSIGCKKKCSKSSAAKSLGPGAFLRIDQFQFVAARQIAARRPLWGSRKSSRCWAAAEACRWSRCAISKLCACSAWISTASICSEGSPPVQTTKAARVASLGHFAAMASARSSAVVNFPPPGPSVPTKSVSQNLHIALCAIALAASPQIAAGKPQNTAARPACAPSPCNV